MRIFGREDKYVRLSDRIMGLIILVCVTIFIVFLVISIWKPHDWWFFSLTLSIISLFFSVGLYNLWTEKSLEDMKEEAEKRELALDYDSAIEIWEDLGEIEEAARVRKLQAEMGSVKVAQKVVHGDEVTEIKDSVLNRSNVGGGTSKMQELEKLTEMKKEGLIDDDEFKQMKKEILG